jgi:RNA polymerase sigma-70 factor (ECF subfamily)
VALVMVETQSDKEIIAQYQSGDTHAFEALYSRHGDRLYSFLVYQVGKTLADDLFQDIMVIIQKHLFRFNPDGNFQAWSGKIALNKIRDHQRRKNRMKKLFTSSSRENHAMDIIDHTTEIDSNNTNDASLEYEETEISHILGEAINRLRNDQREVVNLHYIMGLTFREIAEILECSINTISARARYGLNNIRKILGPKLVDELK